MLLIDHRVLETRRDLSDATAARGGGQGTDGGGESRSCPSALVRLEGFPLW